MSSTTMFGEVVRKLRQEKGETLEKVAKACGTHKGYISGIENGTVNPPSVKVIQKFAKHFKTDAKALVKMAWADKAPEIIRDEVKALLFPKAAKSAQEVAQTPAPASAAV